MRLTTTGHTLSRMSEAHGPSHQSVATTVSITARLGEKLVEAKIGGPLSPTRWHIEAKRPQAGRGHRYEQRRLGLASSGEIGEPGAYELVTREIGGHFLHAPIVRRPRRQSNVVLHYGVSFVC